MRILNFFLTLLSLDEGVDVSNITVPENPAEVCNQPKEVTCISDSESTDCADHVNSYIYESRVYALCVRGDQKLTKDHEKSYKKMISKIQEANLAPVDTRLNYYNNSHVLAIQGFLNTSLNQISALTEDIIDPSIAPDVSAELPVSVEVPTSVVSKVKDSEVVVDEITFGAAEQDPAMAGTAPVSAF